MVFQLLLPVYAARMANAVRESGAYLKLVFRSLVFIFTPTIVSLRESRIRPLGRSCLGEWVSFNNTGEVHSLACWSSATRLTVFFYIIVNMGMILGRSGPRRSTMGPC